jgi:hypothetical protein
MVDVLTALVGGATRSDPLLQLSDWSDFFTYQGYPIFGLNQTLKGDEEIIPDSFEGYVKYAFKASGPVFACELIRLQVFSEARFMYRQLNGGRPGDLFSTPSLNILRKPWPGATTGDLLSRSLLHADLAGNHFGIKRGERIKIVRPDWMSIVIGLPDNVEPDPDVDPIDDLDGQVVGYLYHPGGKRSKADPVPLGRTEVAHFAPIPDPLASYRGMSWLTPVVREIAGDKQATSHKNKFYEQGATPNMVVKGNWTDPDVMKKWITLFREQNEGEANAYKSLILGDGMDATVVGRDFQQLDFKAVQGASETRIAAASGVGAVMAQLSEGMQGSSLNAGNYGAARRRVADGLFRPLWRSFCGSYEQIIPVPRNSELWYDERDIAFLREDAKDQADIQSVRAQSIRTLVDAGYEPDSVVDAVDADDMSLLVHSGLFSVQLQEAGTTPTPGDPNEPNQP